MRRILAAAALAAAALGTTAPAASACPKYGVQDVVSVCWDGWDPDPQLTWREVACVHYGGSSCQPVMVPWVALNFDTTPPEVCVGHGC